MGVLAQGTRIYVIDPADDSVITINKVTTFNPGGAPADQLDDTGLENFEREFLAGLRSPGQASLGLNANPQDDGHVRLYELYETNPSPVLKWAVGWSDGTAPPTVDSNGDWVLPTTRTWFTYDGYIADFPFDFSINTIVASTLSVQRSGGATWTKKA